MADPIKFIFLATADHSAFDGAASARAIELCKRFYASRKDSTGILPAPAVLRFVHFRHNTDQIRVFDFAFSTTARPKPPTTIRWTDLASFTPSGPADFSPANFL